MLELNRTKKDNELFDKFLRMPFEYFKYVHNMYPKNLKAAPYNLSVIIAMHHKLKGRTMLNDALSRKLLYGGIPPQYVKEHPMVTGKKEALDTLESLHNNFKKFAESRVVLYLTSPFESSAIAAGVKLCRKAEATNISWKMEALPVLLGMLKDFDGDHKSTLDAMETLDVVCLYMVGKEYPTEFTTTYFKQLIETRKVAKKVTIICSHLSPEEFEERYGKGISICALGFTDDNEITNFKALRRLVEG